MLPKCLLDTAVSRTYGSGTVSSSALLVSKKARFGRAEQNELVADLTGE